MVLEMNWDYQHQPNIQENYYKNHALKVMEY